MAKAVEIPLSKKFSQDRISEIEKYAKKRLASVFRGLNTIRTEKLSSWRKVYNGTPREKVKSFPWQNASNLIIQLVGSYVDQMVAKIVMGTIAMDPPFSVECVGEFKRRERAEEQRTSLEDFLTYVALEPDILNLIPKYEIWCKTFTKYGFGAIKSIPEYIIEQVAQEGGTFKDFERHFGPTVTPLKFEDFLMPATTCELMRAPFLAHLNQLYRLDLELLRKDPSYNKSAISEALKSPTRTGPDKQQREVEDDSGARTDPDSVNDQWDVYECWYPYQAAGKTFRIISTAVCDETCENPIWIKHVFNWLPDNSLPFIGGWLGRDGEKAYGLGFCEMLKDYQEEVSAIHNRRGDAATLANVNVFRVGSGSQVDSQYSIYPNAVFSGEKDSFEVIPLGRSANETIKDEQMVLQEATDRAGVGPSSSGQGAGTVNKKGAYSAMGTQAVMQEGNSRANLATTSFRVSHFTHGRQLALYYAHFGIPDHLASSLGVEADTLRLALDNYKDRRIALPIRAATGSVNKEIEKQNLMLLLNNVRAHHQMVLQLLTQAGNPMMGGIPGFQSYCNEIILASNVLMKKICKDFGIPDPSSVLPEPQGVREKSEAEEMQRDMQPMGGGGMGQLPPSMGNGGGQPMLPQPQAPGAPGFGTDQNLIRQ